MQKKTLNNLKELSWFEFLSLSDILLKKLPTDYFNYVVCINSGGLILGKLAKDYLSVPLAVISTSAYTNGEINRRKDVEIGSISSMDEISGNVLLIDDLVDQGYTMKTVFHHFDDDPLITNIRTAVIYKKPYSVFNPYYFVEESDKWIIFPYEKNEFSKQLQNIKK
jgi:hypoxanthine phosphoribosyltransferase